MEWLDLRIEAVKVDRLKGERAEFGYRCIRNLTFIMRIMMEGTEPVIFTAASSTRAKIRRLKYKRI